MPDHKVPDFTIVGGQPDKRERKHQIEVPVGLEQLLFLAARDEAVKTDLLADRIGTVARLGVRLRPSEVTTLEAISDAALKAMIGHLRPENPKRRKIMGLVAATVTSLAAGTAVISCDNDNQIQSRGVDPDTSVDGEDAGDDSDSNDTDSSKK